MKVILQQEVKKLGKKGAVIEVAEGYGRNFLLPRGLAIEASNAAIKSLKEETNLKAKQEERKKQDAESLGEKLAKLQVVVKAKSGEGGRLFGSITSSDIAEAVKKQAGLEIDKRKIELSEPIKSLGNYELNVKLHAGVASQLKVKVEAE